MRQRSILWFSLSETTSIEIQANLLKPEINQHQLSFKQNSFEGPVDWAFVGKISGSRGVALSLGAIRAFVGSDLIRAFGEGGSGFRGERFDSGFRGGRFGLSWGAIRAFVGSDSGFRGGSDSGFRGGIRVFMGSDLGFRGELFGFSWGAIWALVRSDSGFRGERFGLSWGRIRAFAGIDSFVGSDSCVRGERFGLSWEGIRAFIRVFVGKDSGFRGFAGRDSKFRGDGLREIERHFGSEASIASLKSSGQPVSNKTIDNLREFWHQTKSFKTSA